MFGFKSAVTRKIAEPMRPVFNAAAKTDRWNVRINVRMNDVSPVGEFPAASDTASALDWVRAHHNRSVIASGRRPSLETALSMIGIHGSIDHRQFPGDPAVHSPKEGVLVEGLSKREIKRALALKDVGTVDLLSRIALS